MSTVGSYILSVLSAAILYAIVLCVTEGKRTLGALIRLICGIFLAFVIISPAADVRLDAIPNRIELSFADAKDYCDDGTRLAENATCEIITEQVRAYILDKADSLGLTLGVEVELHESSPFTPKCIHLTGAASPYAKTSLTNTLVENLGIQKEDVLWLS